MQNVQQDGKALASRAPGERDCYYFNVKGAEATGYPVGQRHKPGFMVLAGMASAL